MFFHWIGKLVKKSFWKYCSRYSRSCWCCYQCNGDGDNSLTLGEDDDVNNGDGDKALTLSGRGDGDDDGDGVDLKGRRALDPILLTLKNEKLVIDLDWCTGVPKFLTILKTKGWSTRRTEKIVHVTENHKDLKNDDSTFKLFHIPTTFQEELLDWTKVKPRM